MTDGVIEFPRSKKQGEDMASDDRRDADSENPCEVVSEPGAIPSDRADVARFACYELDEILQILGTNKPAEYDDFFQLKVTLFKRCKELNSVIMSVLGGDDTRETEEMRKVVNWNTFH